MAKNKIERIDQEIAKTREKIVEQQEKLKDLEAQKTEAENLKIIRMVRAMHMTPAQLNALLAGGMVPAQSAVTAAAPEQEDMPHEEKKIFQNSFGPLHSFCADGWLYRSGLCPGNRPRADGHTDDGCYQ